MKILFLLTFLLIFYEGFTGDGVGDNIIKIMKTTTPLLRPQKGYFLNVHIEENIDDIQKDAIEKGLETQILKLENKLNKYHDDIILDSKEINQERSTMRLIDTAKKTLKNKKK